jgi:hypothetical protein
VRPDEEVGAEAGGHVAEAIAVRKHEDRRRADDQPGRITKLGVGENPGLVARALCPRSRGGAGKEQRSEGDGGPQAHASIRVTVERAGIGRPTNDRPPFRETPQAGTLQPAIQVSPLRTPPAADLRPLFDEPRKPGVEGSRVERGQQFQKRHFVASPKVDPLTGSVWIIGSSLSPNG